MSSVGGGEPEDVEVEATPAAAQPAEFIGQPRVREQLELVLEGARRRGDPPDHILLSGPPGLGKTSLAMIVAAELGAAIRLTSGPALERAGDLAAMLSNLVPGDVLFIDEIHRIARPAEEMLYLAMEDFRVDVVVGKGPGATSHPARHRAVHAGRGDHPVRGADRPAARPVRLHRAHGVLRARRAGAGAAPGGDHPRRRPAPGRGRGDRRPVPRNPADRQPAAAPGPRLRRGARRRRGRPARSPGTRWPSTTSTSWAWTGWTGPCSARWCARSAADRWGCPRWRSRWGRSRVPSKRSVSPTWCVPGCWPAPPGAGWPPRPPGPSGGRGAAGRHPGWPSRVVLRRRAGRLGAHDVRRYGDHGPHLAAVPAAHPAVVHPDLPVRAPAAAADAGDAGPAERPRAR